MATLSQAQPQPTKEEPSPPPQQPLLKPPYLLRNPAAYTFRQHSPLAMLVYNFQDPKVQQEQSLRFSRFERRFGKVWTSRLVPLSIFVGHLYLIALFLRNPFQKVDLD
ncbi:hypothetical protein FGO68_gene17134 [Halteria grandinella]|uniref:Transmembrane protein n=1 Tax=Halteria grandinella TaxID=5974 RepID=A0A8J8NBC8_HALGN|nr:hypothetical protein FGO68_gene17134 [Halteria grandinella]